MNESDGCIVFFAVLVLFIIGIFAGASIHERSSLGYTTLINKGHGRYHPQTGQFELLPMGNAQ